MENNKIIFESTFIFRVPQIQNILSNSDSNISINESVNSLKESDFCTSEFVRSISQSIPNPVTSQISKLISPFLIFRPLPPNVNVPGIDCRKNSIPRCITCKSYLSPFVIVNSQFKSWECPLCHTTNSIIHFTPPYDMTIKYDRPELHHIVYDIIPPRSNHASNGKPRCFLFVVDENLLLNNTNSSKTLISNITESLNNSRPTDEIGLILFSSTVSVVNLRTCSIQSFVEYEFTLMHITADTFFVNSSEAKSSIIRVLSHIHINNERPSYPLESLNLINDICKGIGGRVIFFTSELCNDSKLKNIFFKKLLLGRSISLSVFKRAPVRELEELSLSTSGVIAPFGQLFTLISLFNEDTAWDTTSYLRVSNEFTIGNVMGPCTQLENNVIEYPILNSSQSVIYEIKGKNEMIQNEYFFYQLATRFYDDDGNRKIRIINGKLQITDIIKLPIDESALALYLLRKRINEKNELIFYKRIVMFRNILPNLRFLPILLHCGTFKDKSFINMMCVERFALSVFPSMMTINKKMFKIIWAKEMTIVFPMPSNEEIEIINIEMKKLGLHLMKIYTPQTEIEFDSMIDNEEEAKRWYNEIKVIE